MKRSSGYLVIGMEILLALIALASLAGKEAGLSRGFFWGAILLLTIFTATLTSRISKPFRLASLAILAITLSLITIAALPDAWQLGRDSYFEAQYTALVVEEGMWDPSMGSGFAESYYGHNPALHLIMANLAIVSGISPYLLAKYLFLVVLRLIIVGFVYLVIDALLGREREAVIYLATLLFIVSAGMAFVGLSRRTMGALFLLISVYGIIKGAQHPRELRWTLISGIFALLVVLADHSIAYFYLMFLGCYWLYTLIVNNLKNIRKEKKLPTPLFLLILYALWLFIWEIHVTEVLIAADLSYIDKTLDAITGGFGIASGSGASAALPSIYYTWELVMVYAAQILFVGLGALGLLTALYLLYLKHRKGYPLSPVALFLVFFGLYGFALYTLSSLFTATGTSIAGTILLWFYGIPICILTAMFLRGNVKAFFVRQAYLPIISLILLVLIIGSLLMGNYTPRLVNRVADEGLVVEDDGRARTRELAYAASWLADHADQDETVLGDITVYEMFSGLQGFDVTSYPEWVRIAYQGDDHDLIEMVRKEYTFGNYEHVFRQRQLDYFVVNDLFFLYPSTTFQGKLTNHTLERYDRSPAFDRIYDNGQVGIYAIVRG